MLVFPLTRGFGRFNLGRSTGTRKDMLSMESLLSLFGIACRPIGDKGATPVQLCVLVANNRDVLQGTKAVKGREDILFVHRLGNLGKKKMNEIR